MAQPGTDQHQSRIIVRETTCHTGTAAPPIQSFNPLLVWMRVQCSLGRSQWVSLFLNALFRAAPQGHGDILHPAHGDAGQVHLNECFLNAAFTAAISLNGGSLKGNSLELGYFECDISGSSGEVAAVVAAAVARALLIFLVPGLLRLGLRQLIEWLLYAASHKFLALPLNNFLVKLYNLFRHGLLSPFEWCVATSFYRRSANHVSFYFCESYSTCPLLSSWEGSCIIKKHS